MKKYILIGFVLMMLIASAVSAGKITTRKISSDYPKQPEQPVDGPGGSNYSHEGVIRYSYNFGEHQYWIFEPDSPKPESAPLIVFNHGWSAFYPVIYIGWINHIVKKGNIVVYPRYQSGFLIGFKQFSSNAIRAVKEAIQELQTGNHVHPDLDKFAIVGHSLGGGITAHMAALAGEKGLPTPKAIMPVQPYIPFAPIVDLSKIPSETLVVVLVGQDDMLAGDESGKTIFYDSTQVPLSQKDFVIQVTDTYGKPGLFANHGAPLCLPLLNSVDAMDYYSTWKLFDALTDFAFYGKNGEYCLGDTPEQRFMGLWSDGTPVKELIVTDSP